MSLFTSLLRGISQVWEGEGGGAVRGTGEREGSVQCTGKMKEDAITCNIITITFILE